MQPVTDEGGVIFQRNKGEKHIPISKRGKSGVLHFNINMQLGPYFSESMALGQGVVFIGMPSRRREEALSFFSDTGLH